MGESLKQCTVFALIDKKSCFLALEPIHVEFKSIFCGNIRVVLPYYISILSVKLSLIGQCGF